MPRPDPGAAVRAAAMRTVKLPPAIPDPEPDGPDVTMQRAFLVASGHDPAKVAALDDATVIRTVQQVMERTQSDARSVADELMADELARDDPEPEGWADPEAIEHWMPIAEQVDDHAEAWLVIEKSWPEVDAQGTLDLIQAMILRLSPEGAQAVDEPVDPTQLSAREQRQWLAEQGRLPAQLGLLNDEDIFDEVLRLAPEPEPVPEPVVPPQRIVRPARRHNPGRINITDASDDTPPEFRQAMQGDVQLAAPLKTSPPRKASGHRLPPGIDWPRDSRGRRISPEALAAQQRGE